MDPPPSKINKSGDTTPNNIRNQQSHGCPEDIIPIISLNTCIDSSNNTSSYHKYRCNKGEPNLLCPEEVHWPDFDEEICREEHCEINEDIIGGKVSPFVLEEYDSGYRNHGEHEEPDVGKGSSDWKPPSFFPKGFFNLTEIVVVDDLVRLPKDPYEEGYNNKYECFV